LVLILGYGNSLRRDDGAGLLLAKKLEKLWLDAGAEVECVLVPQLTPDLAEGISRQGLDSVVFVDARVAAGPPDDLKIRLQPLEPAQMPQSLGHHSDPGSLLLIARDLFGRVPTAWLVTVPGVDFGLGESLSPVAKEALEHIPSCLNLPPGYRDAAFLSE